MIFLIFMTIFIIIPPCIWNGLGTNEYKNKTLTKFCCNNKYNGCKLLGLIIILFSRS